MGWLLRSGIGIQVDIATTCKKDAMGLYCLAERLAFRKVHQKRDARVRERVEAT